MIISSLFLVGLVVFLTGYFFLGKSQAEAECKEPNREYFSNPNFTGGFAGVAIGVIFIIFGFALQAADKVKAFESRAITSLR
uniref:Uncharacterized protein n=1 Tax=viral metagenome TaxID=1070528 RepID=A0A6C0E0W5_9ZZZZ